MSKQQTTGSLLYNYVLQYTFYDSVITVSIMNFFVLMHKWVLGRIPYQQVEFGWDTTTIL